MYFVIEQITTYCNPTLFRTRSSKDRWRDNLKPVDLLKRMCLLKGWIAPQFRRDSHGLKVVVGGETFHLGKHKLFIDFSSYLKISTGI